MNKRLQLILAVAGIVLIAAVVLIVGSNGQSSAGSMSGAAVTQNTGAIAYWKFDEGNGTTANDSSGYKRNGTLKNGASFNADSVAPVAFTNAASLNLAGASQQYVDVSSAPSLGNTSFTVAMWVNRSAVSSKQWVFAQGASGNDQAVALGFDSSNHFVCSFSNDDLITSSAYADTGVWHHWACTFDAATKARKIYLDGNLVASDTAKAVSQASGGINIGRATWNEGYFSGGLDDARVYNSALSASDIQALAQGNNVKCFACTN